jgi:hypothetical protein
MRNKFDGVGDLRAATTGLVVAVIVSALAGTLASALPVLGFRRRRSVAVVFGLALGVVSALLASLLSVGRFVVRGDSPVEGLVATPIIAFVAAVSIVWTVAFTLLVVSILSLPPLDSGVELTS